MEKSLNINFNTHNQNNKEIIPSLLHNASYLSDQSQQLMKFSERLTNQSLQTTCTSEELSKTVSLINQRLQNLEIFMSSQTHAHTVNFSLSLEKDKIPQEVSEPTPHPSFTLKPFDARFLFAEKIAHLQQQQKMGLFSKAIKHNAPIPHDMSHDVASYKERALASLFEFLPDIAEGQVSLSSSSVFKNIEESASLEKTNLSSYTDALTIQDKQLFHVSDEKIESPSTQAIKTDQELHNFSVHSVDVKSLPILDIEPYFNGKHL